MTDADDRHEIEQLLYRYAWMVDRREWALMDSVFATDATIDYTSTGGRKGPFRETLAWLDRALAPWPINLHYISNVCITLGGDAATARCMFLAPMGRKRPDGSQEVITNGGYYHDTLQRTAEGWRIRERLCEQLTMIGQLPAGYLIPD